MVISLISVFLVFAVDPAKGGSPQAAKEITVTGIVESTEEDESGNILSVAIVVLNDLDEYEGYYIEKSRGRGKDLLNLVGKTVKVTGTVLIDSNENKILSVKAYAIAKEFARTK